LALLALNTSEPKFQPSDLAEQEEQVLREIDVGSSRLIEGENWETIWSAKAEEKLVCEDCFKEQPVAFMFIHVKKRVGVQTPTQAKELRNHRLLQVVMLPNLSGAEEHRNVGQCLTTQ
jgi:hypothetical protein